MRNIFFVLVCLFLPCFSFAQIRQLDAHEHGAAQLMMAVEGKQLQIEFEVPSESLVGFEYFPEADKDREVFAATMAILSKPSKLFGIPDEAECMSVGIKVSQTLLSGEVKHHEGGDDHDESKSGKDEDHDEHGEDVHSEFHSSYLWNCHHADDLDSVQTRLMEVFPRIEEIRVQWIVEDRQGAMELENQDGLIHGWR